MKNCELCQWWVPLDFPEGHCHRHAPKPFSKEIGDFRELNEYNAIWPKVFATDLCGEFEEEETT